MAKKLFYQTAEFKKLNAKWNEKLKKDGFEDIENGEECLNIRRQIIVPENIRKPKFNSSESYQDLCRKILETYRFKKEFHREIFSLHADGVPERTIKDQIKFKYPFAKITQQGINDIINRVKESFLKGE